VSNLQNIILSTHH